MHTLLWMRVRYQRVSDILCLLRRGVSWAPGANQLLLHAAYEGSCAGTKGGSKLQDESGECYGSSRTIVEEMIEEPFLQVHMLCLFFFSLTFMW